MKNKKSGAYVVYLIILFAILAILYYAVNNFVLASFFNSPVGWLESAVFAIVLIFIYEFVFPRIRRKKKVQE